MTDTPLDLAAVRHANGVTHSEVSALCCHVDALIAEVETLRTQLAEAQLEATKLATEGEWVTEYRPNADGWWQDERQPGDTHQRQVWRGPVQAVEETTE